MIASRYDIPLSRDPAVRLVPWIIGMMTYLACLMLAGALMLSLLLMEWTGGLNGVVTIQVMPAAEESSGALDARVEKLVRLLGKTDGIAEARAIPMPEIAVLLEPWLGAGTSLEGLPLPRLIDVQLDAAAPPAMDGLRTMLSNADPGALLDDHGVWKKQLAGLLGGLQMVATFIVVLVGVATVAIVVFATRSGMAAHRDVIEVLHLIGAQDGYIARQFQNHALSQGLRGGLIGTALGIATLWGLGRAAGHLDTAMLPPISLQPWHWALLVALPVATGLIANRTAHQTVTRTLKRMV